MEADSHDSEVTSATNRLARPINGVSPTKSSSTSDEEGQVEEKNGVHRSQSAASISEQSKGIPVTAAQTSSSSSAAAGGPQAANAPAGPSSSAAAAAASSSSSDRLRDRSPQAVRPSEYWRQESGEGSSYGGLAPRVRGYDGNDQSAVGPPRWPSSSREDRRPYYEGTDSRRRASPHYDRYDPSNRSLSIGSHDDRYRDPQRYSPTARRYDDRDREWERERETWDRASDRERERLRWQRERDWEQQERDRDRDRDREWSRGPHHGRLFSPSRSTPAAASEAPRAYSGTWSGPTSPSSTRRDRYSLGSQWERDRLDRDRYERERDRERERERLPSTGWRHSIASDEAYPARPPHSRSPPHREATPLWSANRASASHVQQSNASSSTPITLRSPEEPLKEQLRNVVEPIIVPATPERPVKSAVKEEPTIDQPAIPSAQPEVTAIAREETTIDEKEDASEQPREEDAAEESKDTIEITQKETVAATDTDELVVAEQTTSEVRMDPGSDDTVMVSTTVDAVEPLVVVDQEEATVDVVPEPIEATAEPSNIDLQSIVPETSASMADSTHGEELRKPLEDDESNMALDVEKVAAMPDVETKTEDSVSVSKSLSDSQAMKSVGADEVLLEALAEEVAEAKQRRSPMSLQLETVNLVSDDIPLPTPRTKEELERVKRESLHHLLMSQRTNGYEVAKVIDDNQKLIKTRSLKPLESAIHGELPRKDHVEPWLDDEDEAVLSMRSKMMKYASARQKRLNGKMELLRAKYKQLNADWQRHCARLDRMSEARDSYAAANSGGAGGGTFFNQGAGSGSAGGLASSTQQSEESSATLASALSSSLTRANRRNTQTGFAGFGDAVRSEAEFLEILASLENADMQDPNMRAARTTATEPEMIINPDEKKLLLNEYDDDNGFVADPVAFYCSKFDPDFWTDEEKTTFVRRYALFPKQFGKIAASLPHKTAKQCVAYYYLTKHAGPDYKSLSAARNRDRKRKSRVKPKKGRGSALMADLKGDDVEEEELQSPGETSTDVAPTSSAARKGGASSRARMLTTSTGSGGADLAAVVEDVGEEESTDVSVGGARKRRGDELQADDIAKRGGGSKAKRSRLEKKGRNNAAAAAAAATEGQPTAAVQQADLDLAAAEALGALAGGMMSSLGDAGGNLAGSSNAGRRKKSATAPGTAKQPMQSPARMDAVNVEDGAKRSRQTTSSYWSVAERNEFLRSLATFEKDWDAIAATLSTKSAAQARNYYARNVDEIEFVEAIALAKENAALSLAERQEQANVFIQKRAVAVTPNERTGAAPPSGYFATPAARGLNINSLLNTEDAASSGQSTRRASYNEWFHKDQRGDDSNDDTEDEDAREGANGEGEHHHENERDMDRAQERYDHPHQYDPHQRLPPAAARHEYEPGDYFEGVSRPSHHSADYSSAPNPRYLVGQMPYHQRHAPSMLSSMPPPSAFLSASPRYQLPGQQQRIGSDGQRSPLPYQHGASDGYAQHRYAFERDPNGGGSAPHRAWSPPSSGPTPPLLETQRHSSWPNAQTSAHLGPSSSSHPGAHSVGRGDSASTSSLSPYGGPPRPSSASGAGFSSLHHLSSARSPYERPHSSNGPISSIRSLSPHPPPPHHQQQQQQQHHLQPPRLPPISQSLFSPRRHSDEGPPH